MNDLFHGFEFIRSYIDELLILTKLDWKNHVKNLELTMNKLKFKGLKCDIEKSYFRQTKTEYLGLCVTRDSVKPINNKR